MISAFRPRILLALLCVGSIAFAQGEGQKAPPAKIEAVELGSTRNVHAFGKTLLCGQPSATDFAKAKQRGIQVVVTLRQKGEVNFDEEGTVKNLGMGFHRFGFGAPESLTDKIFDGSLKVLADAKQRPVLLHCGSANRVGAVWLAHRVLNDGLSVDEARREARTIGLRTTGYEKKALDYIRQRQSSGPEKSVRPGVNERFLDPELQVKEWVGRFEVESREVFAARNRVLKACNVKPGDRVADIGAGTGFYSRLFAAAVGQDGWVFAVDISPPFLQHINTRMTEQRVPNVTTVLCSDRSVQLPPGSVDVAFICDTYHHFEYPRSTLASIFRALKPGGTLVLIDFERIPGKSREFILGHVRGGKDVFRREVITAGFQFVDEVQVPSFQENYLLRFRRP